MQHLTPMASSTQGAFAFVSCKNCILNALYETVHALTGVVCLNVRLKMNKDIAASAWVYSSSKCAG